VTSDWLSSSVTAGGVTATFVGYVVAGFWRSAMATDGIFLPSFLFGPVAVPILGRHRDNKNVAGFVRGVYAVAIGTILGARVLLGRLADLRSLGTRRTSKA